MNDFFGSLKLFYIAISLFAIGCEERLEQTVNSPRLSDRPGWVRLMANPELYDGHRILLRGVIATANTGAGTGIELWMADWARVRGQMEFFVHIQEESTVAFFGGNNTDGALGLEGQLVEVSGIFICDSKESSTGSVPALGQIQSIMICHEAQTGARGGKILLRPDKRGAREPGQ